MSNLHTIDIAVIIGYLILCLIIGLYKSGQIKTIKEYTLGSGRVSTAILFFTVFATHIGAGSTVGTIEKLHTMGLIFAVAVLAEPLLWLVTAKLFAKNIDLFREAGCMSISDIMGYLYGKPGKWVTNILAIFFSIGVIALQVGAIGYLFNYFLDISHALGVLIGFGVMVTYSMLGGIRAVALTDAFQGLVLLVAIPIACTLALHDIGGYDKMLMSLPSTHTSIDLTWSNMLLIASMLLYSVLPISSGAFMQRFLMASDGMQLRKVLMTMAYVSVPFTMVICLIGSVIRVKAPDVDPNNAFFYLINNYLPVGITGLLVSGVLAIIMSTADSWLNTASVVCAHDIIKGLFPSLSDKQELLVARISVLVIASLSVILALAATSIMELAWLAENFWEPVMLVPIIAGFMRFRTNSRSFVGSAILGVTGVLLGKYITGDFATISLLFGVVGSAIGLFGMHYFQMPTGQKIGYGRSPSKIKRLSIVFAHKKGNVLGYLTKLIKKQRSKFKEYSCLFGSLGMIYFLGSSFFMEFIDGTVLHTVVYMKGIAAILCFGLCMHDYFLTPNQQKEYMPIYWYSTLMYCLPFLSSYIALIYNGSMPWMINLMLSTILLYIFGGWFTAIFLSIIGFSIAYLIFKLTGYSLAVHAGDQPKMLGYIYCLLTGVIILILKQKDMLQEQELQTRMLYGAAVAHEVINPLQGAAMMADTLINTCKDKDHPNQISLEEFNDIKALLSPFKESSIAALKTIDRLLTLVRTDISEADDIGIYDINDCVEDTLKTYGLNKNSLSRIQVRKANSFQFKGSKHFVGHVTSNLISNALKYAGSGSQIEIWYKGRELHFADNGRGIATDKLPFIFEPFDKKGSTQGTGVGLPFCKRVMESMGGSIECISGLDKGTEFVLKFGQS